MNQADTSLMSRVIDTRPAAWKSFKFIQQDNFKDLSELDKQKLKESLLKNNFIQPFYVWEHDGSIYCLDGKNRSDMLLLMERDGIYIPELLPATFLRLNDMQEAAKLVLVFSSIYAKITNDGLYDFIKDHDLNFDELMGMVDLPLLNVPKFERLYISEDYSGMNSEINDDDITGDMVLKLKYPKETFIAVNTKLNELKASSGVFSKEDVLLNLLGIDA